jgi:Tol biopolymer transport system component
MHRGVGWRIACIPTAAARGRCMADAPERTMRMHVRVWMVAIGLSLSQLACDGGPTDPVEEPGLSIIAGEGSDTIQAVPLQPLVVRVIGANGKPAAGAVVRFSSVPAPGDTIGPFILVGRVGMHLPGVIVQDTTDAAGEASAWVQMGVRTGPAAVAVAVPSLGFQDTARFTILPGAPVALAAAPRDTAVTTGRSYALRVVTLDRLANLRDDPVSFTPGNGAVTVTPSGVVGGNAFGRAEIVITSGSLADTARVSVVPPGTIAAYEAAEVSTDTVHLVVTELDGTGYRRVVTSINPQYFGSMPSSWIPGGGGLIYHDGGHTTRLFRTDLAGGTALVVVVPHPLSSEGWPAVSADGEWIYYAGVPENQNGALWRVRVDGTGAEQVGPAVDWYNVDSYPSPSPDGTRLAYTTNRVAYSTIRVLDLNDRSVHAIDVEGMTPRWSPDGQWIAYIAGNFAYISVSDTPFGAGRIALIRPDGTGQVTLTQGFYEAGITFSPDGRYIAARSNQGVLHVIEVATGTAVPLPFGRALTAPSWMP